MGNEEEPFQCRCTCEYKQRAFPHLFTYLAPFKPEPKAPEEEVAVEEPVKSKKPPCGVSWDAYRCWMEPVQAEDEDSEPLCRTCPHITGLDAALNPRVVELPAEKEPSMETQHIPSTRNTAGKEAARSKAGKCSDSIKKCLKQEAETSRQEAAAQKISSGNREGQSSSAGTSKMPDSKPKSPPAAAPNSTQRPSEDRLTKEDIVKMLGLNK